MLFQIGLKDIAVCYSDTINLTLNQMHDDRFIPTRGQNAHHFNPSRSHPTLQAASVTLCAIYWLPTARKSRLGLPDAAHIDFYLPLAISGAAGNGVRTTIEAPLSINAVVGDNADPPSRNSGASSAVISGRPSE